MTLRHVGLFSKHMRGTLYELNFLLNVSLALILFYLGTFAQSIGISDTSFGYLMAGAAVISVPAYACVHAFTKQCGIRNALLISSCITGLSLIAIAYSFSFITLLLSVALAFIGTSFIVCLLDAYVSENTLKSHNMGEVRGFFLAASNVAYIGAPAAAGLFAATMGYTSLFVLASFTMIPFFLLVYHKLPDIAELKEGHSKTVYRSLQAILKKPQLRRVFVAQTLYRLFAVISASYIGLYLTGSVGMAIALMSVVLACMEIPYVLVQMPLGKLIDGSWREQTVAMVGFFIIALTTTIIPLAVEITSALFWMVLLFVQRIGGAMVELCLESFFFKHVQAVEQEEVAAFRSIYQITAVAGPAIAATLLFAGGYTTVFFFVTILMVYGVYVSFTLED